MAAVLVQESTAPLVFTKFPDLPLEIRCLIWAKASPSRPRVVQIAYEADKETWRACVDSCGGLPRIIPVCREARQEALKPYTRLLETWIDLAEDTIFISDPMFNIRRPRSMFMDSKFMSSIKRVAFTEDVYFGMRLLYESFPLLVDSPGAIVRKMQGLSHFTLALMEDGGGYGWDSDEAVEFEYFDEDSSTSELDLEEEHGDFEEQNEQELTVPDGGEIADPDVLQDGDSTQNEDADEHDIDDGDGDDEIRGQEPWLAEQEEDATERLRKGYFRNVGDIHFQSAIHSPDYWDTWYPYLQRISSDFDEQQVKDPDWSRPKIAVVEVKYGLHYIGQSDTIDWRSGPTPEEDGSSADNSEDSSENDI
ncbi:uncharacterized protein RSE6_07620 [Rhynchosporium secalis]|uniref:2EXR domain-containing protein n=1 Tax=Rhynchosporium secalis TaxID=38038 RepID=A0A1E1MDA6_RHYSE|nr:uncharacterized protein RSE6_07620 [Rhynchosporium secalis]